MLSHQAGAQESYFSPRLKKASMPEKDPFGDKLRDKERGEEDQYFAKRDRELLEKMRLRAKPDEKTARGAARGDMPVPYKRVLLPLDGSKTSECSIPDAVALAGSTGAELVLLYVIEPISDVLRVIGRRLHIDQQFKVRRAQATGYLDGIRHRIAGRVLNLRVAVETGPPAETILKYAGTHDIDLVVMATHGHSGIKRWLLGSVVNKVAQGAEVPVLLVRARPPRQRRSRPPRRPHATPPR
jgi:nucleotide-binding universal stress UspA family protein